MPSIHLVINSPFWPPNRPVSLTSVEENDVKLNVFADEQGRITVQYEYAGQAGYFITQRISIPKETTFLLTVCAQDDRKAVHINSTALMNYPECGEAIFIVKPSKPQPPVEPYPEIIFHHKQTRSERFFLQTILDVISKVAAHDEYELLKLSGLLRLLLLDSPCLIDLANKQAQLRLEYEPRDSRLGLQAPVAASVGIESIYAPDSPEMHRPKRARNSFIKCPVMSKDERIIRVEDLINACANKAGGVHFDLSLPNKPAQVDSLAIDNALSFMGLAASASVLKDIAQVTLHAVRPLVIALGNPQM
jgi:hypothetical protein